MPGAPCTLDCRMYHYTDLLALVTYTNRRVWYQFFQLLNDGQELAK
jgi:hypothetical protein